MGDLVGNALCLDFANSVNRRPSPDRDQLDSVEELMHWARLAGLPAVARVPDRQAAADLALARELREAVYRGFSSVVSGGEPPAADLAVVMTTYAEAIVAAQPRRGGSHLMLSWQPPFGTREVRWSVAASAAQLLLQGPLERVGECPSCRWLFLDTSRNGRRRWCSMAVCGARTKAQRHYASKKNLR
jgi:predicted RNA-binding Zn ribbon-like protein